MGRRIHGGWIAVLILVVIGSTAAALGLSIRTIAERRWEDIQSDAATIAADLRARDPRRPVLRGTPQPGNTWERYLQAGVGFKSYSDIEGFSAFIEGRGELSREEIQAGLERYLPALDLVRQGVRRADVGRSVAWEKDQRPHHNPWQVAAVGVCRARFLAEEGRAGEAVDLLLDLSQYVIDLAWEGNLGHGLNALYHHQRFLTELKSLMAAGLLDAAQERQVARELSALDAQLPRFGEGAVIGAMEFSFVVLRTKTVRSLLEEYYMDRSSSVPAWKWGYLDKLTLATLADLQLRTAQRMAAGDAGSWEEARRATIEASAELASSVNPLARQGWATGAKPDWLPLHRMFREYLARHRLLIAAARYRADGILPDLDDPFGSKLRSSRSRQLLKLWSLGGDGLDDGGHGDWSTKGCRDIVLEVRR